MNLLVTNTRHAQAYAIIRALRPHARKIVATLDGENRLVARLCQAANSRLVDKRYHVPSPVDDWRAGNIQRENTEMEEAYIRAVLKICSEANIDTIFPSWDPHVYVFSKNKARFERLGILIPVPDYEAVRTSMDKYGTVKAAQEVGFPCPKTYLAENKDDLQGISDDLGFPIMIRPRFTSGGSGMAIVENTTELKEKVGQIRLRRGVPIIQEYIPGRRISEESSSRIIVDKEGNLKACFCTRRLRTCLRLHNDMAVIHELVPPPPLLKEVVRLVRRIGLWGGMGVATKVDPRDGVAKLLEINPRFGSRLWQMTELGINAPLMCIRIARGEAVDPASDYADSILFLEPVEDAIQLGYWALDTLVYKVRTELLARSPVDPLNPPRAIKEMIESIRSTYFAAGTKLYNPHFRYVLRDPVPSILWWLTVAKRVSSQAALLGK